MLTLCSHSDKMYPTTYFQEHTYGFYEKYEMVDNLRGLSVTYLVMALNIYLLTEVITVKVTIHIAAV